MMLLQLTASNGPQECELAIAHAMRLLLDEAQRMGVRPQLLESCPGASQGTWRSVLLALEGEGAPALAQRWCGSVLWVCPSPYRPAHPRKNWFIGVQRFAGDEPGHKAIELHEEDLIFEAVRATGPGGQHVNTTDSAVRVTHRPTGMSVKVQTERSQHANRRLARLLLAHKLSERAELALQKARADRWQQHQAVERGNPKRVFQGPRFVERLAR